MIKSDKINIIVAVAVVFALMVSIALVGIGNMQGKNSNVKTEPEYATKIFGSDIISIEIIADEDDWQEMLDNAINEQYIMADVIVNGVKFQNVGIRPKGNSSLTQVASSDSKRYSFRLQFDEYIKGQTCFGLESFVVNNMIGDNTYMKEYVSYDLMSEIGVNAPYFGYADIKVNGESWGLYLAVELYNDSYEQRVFGDTSGMLYNVKSIDMNGDGGNPPGRPVENAPNMPDMQDDETKMPFGGQSQQSKGFQQEPDNKGNQSFIPLDVDSIPNPKSPFDSDNADSSEKNSPERMDGYGKDMDRNLKGKGGPGNSGGSLEYVDDNTESYSAIFNNVVGKGTEKDFLRVVKAIKALSKGEDLETYFDVDRILRYLAAHTIVVNLDSYNSSMAQNYYIYERDGQVIILPWDYNLAWGGFQSSSASSVINFPIDTPVSGVEMSSRPLLEKLLANSQYLELYHSYLQQLIDNYFANGKFEQKVNEIDALISEYVKNDATAFCTYEEYKTAVSTFIALGNLRAQSVQGQLDGTIPSTTAEQNANPTQLISAGDLKLSDLGSMKGGRKGNNMDFSRVIRDEQFGSMLQSGDQRIHPDDNGKMIQEIQKNDVVNSQGLNFSSDKELARNSLVLVGGLIFVQIVAIIFAAKYKKRY
ncbi:CotH kinase family protein [Lutispora thermophila]|uniref:CotH protein n=1 Tax=Lutispora thermophila DSM 19022 TaxID=1122184 RepID=A0A1M6D633_9FIRM|nr:CotH kinase family protein [Lutispora thermophila]SHI68593.1 CotH protein [Lutispora thermophila DSM 19022]